MSVSFFPFEGRSQALTWREAGSCCCRGCGLDGLVQASTTRARNGYAPSRPFHIHLLLAVLVFRTCSNRSVALGRWFMRLQRESAQHAPPPKRAMRQPPLTRPIPSPALLHYLQPSPRCSVPPYHLESAVDGVDVDGVVDWLLWRHELARPLRLDFGVDGGVSAGPRRP